MLVKAKTEPVAEKAPETVTLNRAEMALAIKAGTIGLTTDGYGNQGTRVNDGYVKLALRRFGETEHYTVSVPEEFVLTKVE